MIGRLHETTVLQNALHSTESEMIAVIGRRRVGKTYLIKEVYAQQMSYYLTGTQNAPLAIQLNNFCDKIETYFAKVKLVYTKPTNWNAAFALLTKCLQLQKTKKKHVLFFDELPWLAVHRSGFVEALGYFWNNWASTANIVVVICGSAASWMLDKVVHQKGSLYNRITKLIQLHPFTLKETEQLIRSKKNNIDHYQIAQIYMALGGIPHYIKEIQPTETAISFINRMCFTKTGMLHNEFDNLYSALFDNYNNHLLIIQALSSKWKGLTRNDILKLTKLSNGGGITKTLIELEASSFITNYIPFGKLKRETLYRLTDEYSLFYIKFIKNNTHYKSNTWLNITKSSSYLTWSGYAFESLCLKHIEPIKFALGIPAVYTQESSFTVQGTTKQTGTQIDLVIDREDRAINLCEMKFANTDYTLSKSYATALSKKKEIFSKKTATKKTIFITIITTYNLLHNNNSMAVVDNYITLKQLFI